MTKRVTALFLMASMLLSVAEASFTDIITSGEVHQGEWTSNFTAAKAMAEKYGVPLVGFWSNPGCSWCAIMQKTCMRDEVMAYMKSKKFLLVHGRGSGGENTKMYNFAQYDAMEGYPFFVVYWPNTNGTTRVVKRFMGRYTDMAKWDTYTGKDWWDTTSHRLRTTLDVLLKDWVPFTIGDEGSATGGEGSGTSGSGTSGGSGTSVTPAPVVDNAYMKTVARMTLPVLSEDASGNKVVGLMDFATTRAGKVSAKYTSMRARRSYSIALGYWKKQDRDGIAAASGSREGISCTFSLTAKGVLSGEIKDPEFNGKLVVRDVAITGPGFSDYLGNYSAALLQDAPKDQIAGSVGSAVFTVKMASVTSAKKGQAKVAIIYPNGKSSSASAYMSRSADKEVLLPVVKKAGAHEVSALFAFSAVPTERVPNVVVSAKDVVATYRNEEISPVYEGTGTIYGSYVSASVRSMSLAGWEFGHDASATAVGRYGAATDVLWPSRISISSQGLIKGSAKVVLGDARKVSAKFAVGCLPGWERELGVKALGTLWYRDKVNGRNATLGFPVALQPESGK